MSAAMTMHVRDVNVSPVVVPLGRPIRTASATPVQIGENFTSVFDTEEAVGCAASDFVVVDAQQSGGVTGWLAAAAIAQVHAVEVSSHLFQEVTAHLLAVTEASGWLEYMNVANPILAQPLRPAQGRILASTHPGIGLAWDADAVQKYRLS